MPVIQPAEIWKRTGRYGIEELFKLEDRKGSELVAGDDPRGGRSPSTSPTRSAPTASCR